MYTVFFFFNDTATTEIYTLSLHDALPICPEGREIGPWCAVLHDDVEEVAAGDADEADEAVEEERHDHRGEHRSEEHTSELQSRQYLVCRLLLEKKKKNIAFIFNLSDLTSS